MYIVQVFTQVEMLNAWNFKSISSSSALSRTTFVKTLLLSPLSKLKSYKEAIVAFWKKLSVSIFVT